MRLALLALAALVWIAVPVSARAEGTVDVWDGSIATEFAGGDGLEGSPYQIETGAQLAYLAQQVNGGEDYYKKYFVLTGDIDLNSKEWMPIGNDDNHFQGNFDGQGHTVSGMQISGSSNYVGLFGYCARRNVNIYIKDITVANSKVSGCNYVGAIVGCAEEVRVLNCRSIDNEITGQDRVGGICGFINCQQYGTISECYNSSTVKGRQWVGGIAGQQSYGKSENCLNVGNIIGISKKASIPASEIGGIFGAITSKGTASGCVNLGSVSGKTYIGEIVGNLTDGSPVSDCYYNSDTAGAWGIGSQENAEGVTPLIMVELCGNLPKGLDSNVWAVGSGIDKVVRDNDNSDFGTRKVNYLYLKSAGEVEVEQKVYNFGTETAPDWETYIELETEDDLYDYNFDPDEVYWKIDYTKNYVLSVDIDFSEVNNDGYTISPIGDESHPFTGKFSGNDHTISNVYINNSDASYVGLFGYCDDASVIKNLTVSNSAITGKSCVGAIAGRAGNIIGCKSLDNTVTGSSLAVGGICGWADGKVFNCYNDSAVTGDIEVGGICGYFNTEDSATLSQCVSLGKVSAKGNNIDNFAGGIVGYHSDNAGSVTACYYDSDIVGTAMNTVSGVTPLTTVQLCGALPEELDATFWKKGRIGTATVREGRFGDAEGTYLSPKSMETARSAGTIPLYNFATTGGDDWDIYTLITTAEEFAAIGQNRDEAKWSANYVLGNDIDVSGVQLSSIGDPGTPYTGKFSGDGHTIGYVNMTGNCLGLFGAIGYLGDPIREKENGKVMLLAANGAIVSSDVVGGICGYLCAGEIYGCSFIGTVKGFNAGGICGMSGVYDKISQCFFAGEVQGSSDAAGICGVSGTIDHCISIGTITCDADRAGISNSGDPNPENCYFNNDIYKAGVDFELGRSTQQLASSGFFKELETKGFDLAIWTKKSNDKENGIAYYPSLGENNAVGVKYTTGLLFERTDNATPTYGQDITFNVKALVNFVTDGRIISAEDPDGSFEIRIGDEIVVKAEGFRDGTATYNARTAGETTFTLVYKGNDNSFFSEKTKDLTVNIAPAELKAEGAGIASGIYGNKLSELTVTGLAAKLGSETIDGTWQIQSDDDKVPYVGDSETYTATFIPEHPECYQPLMAQVTLKIDKAKAPKIQDLYLEYSWAAKGEKVVQIPGLPEDMGETTMEVTFRTDSKNVLAADPDIKYSEGKLLFTLGENTMDDIGEHAIVRVQLRSKNYKDIEFGITITRTEKSDREDTPDPDAFDMTFTVSGNDLAAEITTDRTDVEFSFDGTDWGQTKSAGVGHNEKVTAQIRYAETDDYNPGPAISKTWNSGHGTLTHHDRVEPTCQAEGSIEYWTCDVCGLYFAAADGSKSITAAEIVLPKTDHSWAEGYLSDMTGHWHKCSVCGVTSNTEKHVSGGAATTERAEICTVCGYEIAPKKPAASSDDDDDDDDDSSQASNTGQKTTDAGTSSTGTTPPAATATPATPGVVKPSVIPVTPTTPTADENRKEDAAKPSGEAQDTQESSGEAPQEERTDSMTAQTSGSQESGTEQITETSGKGTNAGRVAAAAAAGTAVVGGGGAAIYVTIKKGKFKFK